MKSVSPTKQGKSIKLQLEGVYREELPDGLLAMGLCKKEGRTMGSNQRLLVLNEGSKTIGYCNDPPKELPVGDPSKIKLKHRGLLMTCETRINSDSKNELVVNAELEPEKPGDKPKKDRWVMIFSKPEQAKEWDVLIKTTKQKIRDAELRATKPPAPQPNMMMRSEMPIFQPTSFNSIEPRVPSQIPPREEPLPIDSYIRQATNMGGSNINAGEPLPANSMIESRTELQGSRNAPLAPTAEYNPRQVVSVYQPQSAGTRLPNGSLALESAIKPKPSTGGLGSIYEQPEANSSLVAPPPPYARSTSNPKPPLEIMIPATTPSVSEVKPTEQSNVFRQSNENPRAASNIPSKIPQPQSQPSQPYNKPSSNVVRPGASGQVSGTNWNQMFATSNPITTMTEFQRTAEQTAVRIIDELAMERSIRKHQPVEVSEGHQYYEGEQMEIVLALDNETEDSVRLVKNEWRNYNYILSATRNQGRIRVPLACIVEYKGVTVLVKATILDGEGVAPSQLSTELAQVERLTKISREVFTKDDRIRFIRAKVDGIGEVVYLWNLFHFIPVDLFSERELSQLRQETIETLDRPVGSGPINFTGSRKLDKSQLTSQGLREAGQTMRSYSEQVLGLLENFQIVVLNTKELISNLHLNGVNIRALGEMHKRARNPFVKKYLVSEMAARACSEVFRKQLQHALIGLAANPASKNASSQSDVVLLDLCFALINDFVSNNPDSDSLWRTAAEQMRRKFHVVSFSKDDLSVGFFLSSFFDKTNLTFNYEHFLKDKNYLRASNLLKRDFVRGFGVRTRCYQIGWTDLVVALEDLLNTRVTPEGCERLIEMLALESNPLPEFCEKQGYDQRIRVYLSSFINSEEELDQGSGRPRKGNYKHLELYRTVLSQPPTYRSIRLAIQAIKWELNLQQNDKAESMFEVAEDLVTFWGGESHVLLGELYDVFAAHYGRLGNYDRAIDFAKSSIQNAVKLAGSNSLLAANKYYEYGSLCFKAGRKDDALANFIKTRETNQNYHANESREHAALCMKMSLLYLNLGQNSECLSRALESLKIVEGLPDNEEELVNLYELLFRQYEITEQKSELNTLAVTAAKKLKDARDPKIVERLLKLVIHPSLKALPFSTRKQLIDLVLELKQRRAPRLQQWKKQAYQNFYLRSEHENFSLQVLQRFQKAERLLGEIFSKKLAGGYSGPELQPHSENEQLLQDLDVVSCLVGDSFLLGVLREED